MTYCREVRAMSEKFPIVDVVDLIPLPEDRRSRRSWTYPFNKLEVGKGFFVPSSEPYFTGEKALCAGYHRARRELGYNLCWEKVEGGYVIWREPGVATSRRHKETVHASHG
jgi:hypothetical protein